MAFLDNARSKTDEDHAQTVRDAIVAAQQASDQGESVDLVEVVVRYQRMSQKYEEAPIVIPRSVLPSMRALAMNYLFYTKLHIDANVGNSAITKFVALTPDKELLTIELVSKDYQAQTDEDIRRSKFVAS